eukprot:4195252-Pyramimonas_sp.AAC.1
MQKLAVLGALWGSSWSTLGKLARGPRGNPRGALWERLGGVVDRRRRLAAAWRGSVWDRPP